VWKVDVDTLQDYFDGEGLDPRAVDVELFYIKRASNEDD
jgi:hypothetical protein